MFWVKICCGRQTLNLGRWEGEIMDNSSQCKQMSFFLEKSNCNLETGTGVMVFYQAMGFYSLHQPLHNRIGQVCFLVMKLWTKRGTPRFMPQNTS